MSEKRQTAVEWFHDNVDDFITEGLREKFELLKNEAKQLERKQIIEAFNAGASEEAGDTNYISAERYYNRTYETPKPTPNYTLYCSIDCECGFTTHIELKGQTIICPHCKKEHEIKLPKP